MRAHLPTAASIARLLQLLALGLLLSPAAVLAQSADASVPPGQKPVIATGTVPDEATRAAILQRLRELASPGMVMSGSKDEGTLLGNIRPQPLPPGRGWLVTRRGGNRLIQVAWRPPAE